MTLEEKQIETREALLADLVKGVRGPLDEWMHGQQWGTYLVKADRDQFSDDFVITLRIVPVKYEGMDARNPR